MKYDAHTDQATPSLNFSFQNTIGCIFFYYYYQSLLIHNKPKQVACRDKHETIYYI